MSIELKHVLAGGTPAGTAVWRADEWAGLTGLVRLSQEG